MLRSTSMFCMKHVLLYTVFVFASLWNVAADETDSGENTVFRFPLTEASMPRFLSICADLSARPVVTGDFSQKKTIKKLNRVMNSSGVYVISADDGLVWDTKKPFPSTMIVGLDRIVQTTPGGTHQELSAAGNETFTRIAAVMSAVFTGSPRRLLANFDVFFQEQGRESWRMGLLAKDASIKSFAEKIYMSGTSGGGAAAITHITVFQKNGDTVTWDLSNQIFLDKTDSRLAQFF